MPTVKTTRMCFFVPTDGYIKGRGWRASVVTEGKSGHCPTGVWPNNGTEIMPYFWGASYEDAQATAARMNARLGHSEKDVAEIIFSSMNAKDEP